MLIIVEGEAILNGGSQYTIQKELKLIISVRQVQS